MKFRRPLRRDVVMCRLAAYFAFVDVMKASEFGRQYLRPEARAGAQLPQDERRTEEASPEGARQLGLF